MKKTLLSLSILIGASTMLSAQNLLQNANFEGLATLHQPKTGNTAIDWSNSNSAAPYVSGGFNYSPGDQNWRLKKSNLGALKTDFYPAEESNAGTQSLKLQVDKGHTAAVAWYNNAVYQQVSVDKTKKYEVKLWAKGNGKIFIQFYTNYTGTSATAIGGQPSKTFDGTEPWSEYTFTLDIPAKDNSVITDETVYTNKTIFAIGLVTAANEAQIDDKYVWIDNIRVYDAETGLGLDNEKVDVKMPIYVNGGTAYFSIEEAYKVTLFDVLGKVVLTKTIQPGESLPIQAQGCFIVKLDNGKGNVHTQKLVVK